jgi:hypothetical protein
MKHYYVRKNTCNSLKNEIFRKIVPSNLKTLIILIGECRGGEETWRTMYIL